MARYDDNKKMSYWQSYSDMMAALLLVFVLIISYTLLQSKVSYQQKEMQLSQKEQELEKSKKEIDKKDKKVQEQKAVMQKQQNQLDRLVGVKTDLIKVLSDEFKDSDLKIMIDQKTGAITFDSSVLFDTNKYEVKKSGIKFLNQFVPKYFDILLSDEFSEFVSEVIIEGHTDTEGTYMRNLELSQKRAFAVASYCLDEEKELLGSYDMEKIRSMVTANGKSWSDPIYKKNGEVNLDKSRRVEFKFRLKNEEMIDEMKKILEKKVKRREDNA